MGKSTDFEQLPARLAAYLAAPVHVALDAGAMDARYQRTVLDEQKPSARRFVGSVRSRVRNCLEASDIGRAIAAIDAGLGCVDDLPLAERDAAVRHLFLERGNLHYGIARIGQERSDPQLLVSACAQAMGDFLEAEAVGGDTVVTTVALVIGELLSMAGVDELRVALRDKLTAAFAAAGGNVRFISTEHDDPSLIAEVSALRRRGRPDPDDPSMIRVDSDDLPPIGSN